MKKLNNLEVFDWIKNELWTLGERPDGLEGHTVRHGLPPFFDSCFKLLHPIFIGTTIKDLSITWNDVRDDKYEEVNLKRIYWRDLVKEHKIRFIPEICWWSFFNPYKVDSTPRYIVGPHEGNLEAPTLMLLEKILAEFTNNDEAVYFCCNFLATHSWESAEAWHLYEGYLKEKNDFENLDEVRLSPTYWWPESKDWCVCTDYDLEFTLIGGSQDLIKRLSSSQELEGFIVNNTTRIDYKADTFNV